MPKPYSLDLRERVVGFVEDGQSRRAAAARFRVSVSFVVNLMQAAWRGNMYWPDARLENTVTARMSLAIEIRNLRPRVGITLPHSLENDSARCSRANPEPGDWM